MIKPDAVGGKIASWRYLGEGLVYFDFAVGRIPPLFLFFPQLEFQWKAVL